MAVLQIEVVMLAKNIRGNHLQTTMLVSTNILDTQVSKVLHSAAQQISKLLCNNMVSRAAITTALTDVKLHPYCNRYSLFWTSAILFANE